MTRTIVIGDIHGCLKALNAVLEAAAPTPEDIIVTVGDYVDRGPDSKGVIDRLLELQRTHHLVALRGNHEDMMLEVIEGREPPYQWLNHGGVETMDSYGFVGDLQCVSQEHRDFLKSLRSYFENDTHFVVHANYDPQVSLEDQTEQMLRWEKLSRFVPGPHFNGKKGVLGHTHDRDGEIFEVDHLICIDTYCYGGKWLTAYELETGRVWQANMHGEIVRRPEQ